MDYTENRRIREEVFQQVFGVVSMEELKDLLGVSFVRQVRKSDHIVRIDEPEKSIHFLYEGCFRYYNFKTNMQELTDFLVYNKGEIIASNPSMTEEISMHEIEALTNAIIVVVTIDKMREILEKHPRLKDIYINRICDILQNQYEIQTVRRTESKERCEWFNRKHAKVKPLIMKKIIASFLDMDQATYSRVNS